MKLFLCMCASLVVLAGCANLSVSKNSLRYKKDSLALSAERLETGNPKLQHVRVTVTTDKVGEHPRISGSMTALPNGQQVDVLIDATTSTQLLPPPTNY